MDLFPQFMDAEGSAESFTGSSDRLSTAQSLAPVTVSPELDFELRIPTPPTLAHVTVSPGLDFELRVPTPPTLAPVTVSPGLDFELRVPTEPTNPALSSLPPELVKRLFLAFFSTCYNLAPIVHISTFLEDLESHRSVLLYAMMALAAKSCPEADPAALLTRLGRSSITNSKAPAASSLRRLYISWPYSACRREASARFRTFIRL